MRKKICKILISIIVTMFALTTISFAKVEIYLPEKTEAYERWENLGEEEKQSTVEPKYYSLGIKESLRRSKYNRLLGQSTTQGTSFDLSKLYQTIIKDQRRTEACWAFSTTSMLESTVAVRNKLLGREYSPFYMEYMGAQMYNKSLGYGGNITMAMAIIANGKSPILESDFLTQSVYNESTNSADNYYLSDIANVNLNQQVQLKVNKTTDFPPIYKVYNSSEDIAYSDGKGTTYTLDEVNVAREKIKSHIKNYGSVTATMYIDIAININQEFVSPYYDSANNMFCYTGSSTANHQVAIVGWDNSKNAYIVQNSYGEAFGNNGIFYISYDDTKIEENIYGINELEDLSTSKSYDNIYLYDELGMNYGLKFRNTSEAYYANVFSRDTNVTDKDEYITEVGLYIMDTTGIEIYVNSKDGDFIDTNKKSKLNLVHSGEILEPGYHVIKLNATEHTKLSGEKFIIAVKSINQEGAILPIESNLYDSKFTFSSNMYDTATANNGESFYSEDMINWNELNGTQVGSIQILKNTNACVRAFTKYTEKAPEIINVTGVSLDKTDLLLKVEQTENLIATVTPESATNKNIIWTSSDSSIATIANGVVTAVKQGNATITVTTIDGEFSATCSVEVQPKDISVTGISIMPTNATIEVGNTVTLTATVLPENATNKNITWQTSDENVATIVNGVVTGINKGTATITVKTIEGNFSASAVITVEEKKPEEIKVESVTLDVTSKTLKIGETLSLTPVILPANATNKNVTWTTSDESIATVTNGVITAIKAGEVTITVTTEDGKHTDVCDITVAPNVVKVESVSIDKENQTVNVGETVSLTATVLPANATNKNIIWRTSDSSVATVSAGVVTALKAGTATITVETEEGKHTDTFLITVNEIKNPEVKVESIEIDKKEIKLEVSDKATLVIKFNPELPTNTKINWKTSNAKVATVDENGIVKAIGPGTATITAISEDGGYTAKCTITVSKQKDDPDDIYKEENEKKDETTIKNPLPNAGANTMFFIILGIIVISMGVSFIKFRKLRDVK